MHQGEIEVPKHIRVSIGTAAVLELTDERIDVKPTTAYLMTYKTGKCTANCSFCPQARKSTSKSQLLSRVSWPVFSTEILLQKIKAAATHGKIKRVCIQALNYPTVFFEIFALARALKQCINVPISVSCQPLNSRNLWLLYSAGVDRMGIALDAATEDLFKKIKGQGVGGPYKWPVVHTLLRTAIGVFGEGNVSTHFIVGLGETEKEMVSAIEECINIGVLPALFAFTAIPGTSFASHPKPEISAYRRIQLSRYLLVNGQTKTQDMRFDRCERITDFGVSWQKLLDIVGSGDPFLTSGCPGCNRPFYNEKPSGPLYNYPRSPSPKEVRMIKRELNL